MRKENKAGRGRRSVVTEAASAPVWAESATQRSDGRLASLLVAVEEGLAPPTEVEAAASNKFAGYRSGSLELETLEAKAPNAARAVVASATPNGA